jgi:hypothetical protein
MGPFFRSSFFMNCHPNYTPSLAYILATFDPSVTKPIFGNPGKETAVKYAGHLAAGTATVLGAYGTVRYINHLIDLKRAEGIARVNRDSLTHTVNTLGKDKVSGEQATSIIQTKYKDAPA